MNITIRLLIAITVALGTLFHILERIGNYSILPLIVVVFTVTFTLLAIEIIDSSVKLKNVSKLLSDAEMIRKESQKHLDKSRELSIEAIGLYDEATKSREEALKALKSIESLRSSSDV